MAAFLRKAKRRALTRRALAQKTKNEAADPTDLLQALRGGVADGPLPDGRGSEFDDCEIDPTPTPRPVTVDLSAYAAPASARPGLGRLAPHGTVTRRRRLAVAVAAMALFAAFALAIGGAPRSAAEAPAARSLELKPITVASPAVVTHAEPTFASMLAAALHREPAPPPPPEPRADARVNREMYGHIRGGVLFVPKSFSSEDGTYDLYLHFHGNTRVVLESAEVAGLNALVAVVNLGVNSAPYLDEYAVPGSFEGLLESIDRAAAERGLAKPKLRRLAFGSWSGGYGAISRILETGRAGLAKLDAMLVLDGIHCGFLEENPKALNVRIISPFLDAAKRAADGKLLFSITHSEIEPIGYAGTNLTAGYLLGAVKGERGEPGAKPEHLALRAAEGAVAKKLEKRMEPISDSTVGTFHVRGYRGNTPEHHMAHLLQMGATVMPELVARWTKL